MITRIILTFAVFLLFQTSPAFAELTVHSTVKVESPVYDFGNVASGITVNHEFRVSNSGNSDLVVNKVIPSCGCTAGKMVPEVLEPGESGVIKVSFDTTGFSGRKVKTIRLYTNDPESDSVLLTMKGQVEPDTVVEPRQVFMSDVVKDGKEIINGAASVKITAREGTSLSIGKVKTFSKYLRLTEVTHSKKQKEVKVEVLPNAPKGELRDKIIVSIKGGRRSSVNIPVYAVIQGPVRASQSVVSFGVVKGDNPIRKSIKVENRGKEDVVINEVTSSHTAVAASIVEVKPGRNFVLHLDLNPTALESDLKGTVRVVTNNVDSQSIPVSVVGILPLQ